MVIIMNDNITGIYLGSNGQAMSIVKFGKKMEMHYHFDEQYSYGDSLVYSTIKRFTIVHIDSGGFNNVLDLRNNKPKTS